MKSLCLILILALCSTPACSRFSSSARNERAYAKYLRKSSSAHQKRQARFRKEKSKMPSPESMMPSEPRVTMEAVESPQSVSSDSSDSNSQ